MAGRRGFLIAGSAGMWMLARCPASSAQQQGKVWRIGYLDFGSRQTEPGRILAFIQGMKALGYIEGKHFIFEPRFADGQSERLSALAEELVQLHSDIIVARQTSSGQAAQRATTTIPIVVAVTADPIRDGFAMTLAKPGGNITGLSSGSAEIIQKHVELLATAVPRMARIAVLLNPTNPSHTPLLLSVQVAAQRAGRQVLPVTASKPEDLNRGFASMARSGVDAVIVLGDAFFVQQRRQIAELALKHRLASTAGTVDFEDSGVLLVYGANNIDNHRRAAILVDRILKGAKPGELPFELPTRYQLVINRKTASALGITIPQSILVRADRVIE